jgi:large subunit ribosomal protein L24
MTGMGARTEKAKIKLRKNDVVKVITGREKGKTGRIVRIDGESMRAVVEGLNMVKKAVKQKKQNQKAGITTIEAPLALAKLMIVCKKCGATRIGYKVDGERKTRVCRKCGGEL